MLLEKNFIVFLCRSLQALLGAIFSTGVTTGGSFYGRTSNDVKQNWKLRVLLAHLRSKI
jgi:hypothetical protein